MKKGLMFIMAFAMMTAVCVTSVQAQRSVSLQVFYDELQPYGTWMDHGQYGYVWIPRVGPDFMPYGTNGYWINTQYGNTWVSEYEWGWAPFHYGRWFFDDFYGWIWVPDTVWGPAWVAWRTGGGYYGWAPLMPGFGIHLSVNYYNRLPHRYWSFVPYRYVTYRHVYRHCVPRPTVVNIINNTTIITHNHTDDRRQTYFTGPSRSDIERRGGGRVVEHSINESDRPGKTEVTRDGARFYKPQVEESRGSRSRAIPATYVKKNPDGQVETVRSRVDRTNADPNTSRTIKELQRTTRMTDRENSAEIRERQPAPAREEQSERKVPTEIERNDYQRTGPGTLNRYERIQREPTNTARDRYEAPPVQRRNSREVPRTYTPQRKTPQQRTYEAPRTTERQRYVQPQQRNVERQQNTIQRQRTPSYRENSSRSIPQQRTMQYRKSQPSNSGQPKINSGSRSAPSRQRN